MRRVRRCVALAAAWPLAAAVTVLAPLAWADTSAPAPAPPPEDRIPAIAGTWPVGVRPTVLRGFEPPATVYGPGHRGVDLGAPAGTPVRAVAAGRVTFAGRVAGRGVLSMELTGTGLRTTYEPVSPSVKKGDRVRAGETVGTVEPTGSHCGAATCVHWGLLRDKTYLDPLSLLPPWLLRRGPSRLLPVLGYRYLPDRGQAPARAAAQAGESAPTPARHRPT